MQKKLDFAVSWLRVFYLRMNLWELKMNLWEANQQCLGHSVLSKKELSNTMVVYDEWCFTFAGASFNVLGPVPSALIRESLIIA
eukprot:509550-Amphidinium_carterae.1